MSGGFGSSIGKLYNSTILFYVNHIILIFFPILLGLGSLSSGSPPGVSAVGSIAPAGKGNIIYSILLQLS